MLKCSRCRHIFPAPSSKPVSPKSSPRAKPVRPSEESLTLPFDDGNWKEGADGRRGDEFDISEPEEAFTLGTEDLAPELPVPEPDDGFVPSRPRPSTASPLGDDELDLTRSEDDMDEVPAAVTEAEVAPTRRRPASRAHTPRTRVTAAGRTSYLRPLFVFLAVMVAVYGFIARTLLANPPLTDRLVGQLPIIGVLGNERLLVRKIALSDVTGAYQRIRNGKTVFVISGRAVNTAPVPLHGVQIAGKLMDSNGAVLDQKVISCGNVISAKVLKDLTPQEVSILQKLNPPQRFTIGPGESSTFVIVFMDPPHHAAEFVAQAVAARRQT